MICDMVELDSTAPPVMPAWSRRVSRRARRLSVRVFVDGRVEIIIPVGASESIIERFVARHRTWIEARVARCLPLGREAESFPPADLRLTAIDEHWRIDWQPGEGRARFAVDGQRLRLSGEVSAAEWRRVLLTWMKRRGQTVVAPRLDSLAQAHGYRYSALRWRCQRTRWGSCSIGGVLNLNVCVLFQTPEVLNYLLCHELAHLRHPNHSAAYWSAVADLCPQWQTQDRSLRLGWRRVPRWVFS